MQDVDWNLAIARLIFVQGHLRQMRKEIAMKNEKLAERAEQARACEEKSRQAPAGELRRPWPARRRFWHRAVHRPEPTKPQPVGPHPAR